MNISSVPKKDLPEILELLRLLVIDMQQKGLDNWDETYPAEMIPVDIDNKHLYKIAEDNVILGILALNEEQDQSYAQLTWQYKGKALTVHRLAVHPKAQRKGIGRRLMTFAEEFAQKEGYNAIRLDAYSKGFIKDFYEKLNYQTVGHVILNPELDFFVCLEKEIRR